MAREINLVPDIKDEMIRTLKLRNFIFFLCIIVAGASIALVLLFGTIVGGQSIAIENKQKTIETLSKKVESYSDLTDFLTIKDQLNNLSDISANKNVLSRTFNIISALVPNSVDTITFSELSVNLSDEIPTITFDAHADAKKEPFIDYNVLDSFKKSMQYMRYDFGRYVDKDGKEIPTYCIIENSDDGATLKDATRGIYAYWTITESGCNPKEEKTIDDKSEEEDENDSDSLSLLTDYELESFNDKPVVRIWRTPQFSDWYESKKMTLDGSISNVAHFKSSCITYSSSDGIEWGSENTCKLVPDGIDGIKITGSSNGRSANGSLVLRFTARISLNPEVYKFNNKHVLAISPEGRYNVTDSYTQVQAMFGERAADCSENDTACKSNSNNNQETNTNTNGGNNG